MWPDSGPPSVAPSAARRRRAGARPEDDSGAVAILVALLTTVFVALAALVVDHGLSADTQRRAQNAADAASLAAALVLAQGGLPVDADTKARDYALADFGVAAADWTACTSILPAGFVPVTSTSCISQNTATKQARVVLPSRRFSTIFAGIAGFSSQTVTGAATAAYTNTGIADCVLCILDRLNGGTGGVQVTGGNVIGNRIEFQNANGSIDVTTGGIGFATSFDPK